MFGEAGRVLLTTELWPGGFKLCQIQDSGKKQTECYADPDPRPSSPGQSPAGFSVLTAFTWIRLPSVGLVGRNTRLGSNLGDWVLGLDPPE